MLFTPWPLIFHMGTYLLFLIFSDKIATGSFDQTVKIWSTDKGELLSTLKGHTAEIVCLSFDPLSFFMATGSMDNTAILWNIETNQQLMKIDVYTF